MYTDVKRRTFHHFIFISYILPHRVALRNILRIVTFSHERNKPEKRNVT